jgi:hypothetical protein
MSRTLSSGVAAAIAAPVFRPVFFVRLEFDEGTERACTAPYSIWFDDDGTGPNEFIGVGALGTISAIEEGSELRAYGMSVTLNGCDPTQLATSLDSKYQGRPAAIYLGFLDADHVLIDAPVLVQNMVMDTMPIELGKEGRVTVTMENVLSRWENPNPENLRYADADQQSRYPGDRGYEFASVTVAREIVWGRA